MSYILHILTPYRYPILAALSLLLIAEMALAAVNLIPGVNLIPIEYEWVLGWLTLLTIVAWAGIAMVIGVSAPTGGDAPKRRGHLIWILSPTLFAAMLVLLAILGANIFQAQFLLDVFWQPYLLVLVVVWIGMVVTVGATANVESSKKTYLFTGIFPLLILAWTLLFWTTLSFTDEVLDLSNRLLGANLVDLVIPLGALFIVLSTSLVIGAVLRRSAMVDSRRIVVAITAFGISIFLFFSAMGIGVLLYFFSAGGSPDAPGAALGVMAIMPVLWSLATTVLGAVLIGRMRRPIRNITVAGIGMAAMILVFGWYWFLTVDDGLDAFSGQERGSAARALSRADYCESTRRVFKRSDGTFLVRSYSWWRFSTDCR